MIRWLCLLFALGLSREAAAETYVGYVEAEYVRAAPTIGGRLVTLAVERGRHVVIGDVIGELDRINETAQFAEAKAKLAEAQAQLADLETGRRPPEIDVIENQRRQAQAELKLSREQVERQSMLAKAGVASRDALDQAVMRVNRDEAHVRELDRQLDVAKLAAREKTIDAARAAVEAAKAELDQARWRLDERTVKAEAEGVVSDVIYRPGEQVPAGGPIALILSPAFVKLRFFVPQRDLPRLPIGAVVNVECDGCAKSSSARVSYIAPEAEFTPPVIYSDQAREKLVFMIEARPETGAIPIAPGQPITVTLK